MYYFKSDGVMLAKSWQWEEDIYGFAPDGIGDCIWRSAIAAIAYKDSSWIITCAELLEERKRWPDTLDHNSKVYRKQSNMTRDPYILFFSACNLLHQHQYFADVKIPFYLQRPDLYHWVRYIKTGKEIHKKGYEFYVLLGLKLQGRWLPMYAKQLEAFKAYSINSEVVQRALLNYIPDWNYLLRALCNDDFDYYDLEAIQEYKSRKKWMWQNEDWYNRDYIPEGEDYYLDKDILNGILYNQGREINWI